jgi:hypothetical protein
MQHFQSPKIMARAQEWRGHQPSRRHVPLSTLGALLPAVALLMTGLAALAVATLMPTGAGGQYGVVAPPWYTLSRTIALVQRAQGQISDAGGPANIVIAHGRGPGFEHALYAAGAWLVIDPMQLRGCAGFAPANGNMR